MPTLVHVEVPVGGRSLEDDSSDVDETTLESSAEFEHSTSTTNRNTVANSQEEKSKDESREADMSVNMMLYNSLSSSEGDSIDHSSSLSDDNANSSVRRRSRNRSGDASANGQSPTIDHNNNIQHDGKRENPGEVDEQTTSRQILTQNCQVTSRAIGKSNDVSRLPLDETILSNSDTTCDNDLENHIANDKRNSNYDQNETRLSVYSSSDSGSSCSSKTSNKRRDRFTQQSPPVSRDDQESGIKVKVNSEVERPQCTRNRHLCTDWGNQNYCDTFKDMLRNLVTEFKLRNASVELPEYSSLAPDEQRMEQDRVIKLLDRLGIRELSGDMRTYQSEEENSMALSLSHAQENDDESFSRFDNSPSALFVQPKGGGSKFDSGLENSPRSSSAPRHQHPGTPPAPVNNNKQQSTQQQRTRLEAQDDLKQFGIQLSPIPVGASPKTMILDNTSKFILTSCSPMMQQGSPLSLAAPDSASERSIEITRGDNSPSSSYSPVYRSPEMQMMSRSISSKRMASTSGKRGSDKCRTKLKHPPLSDSDSDSNGILSPASQPWNSSNNSLSMISTEDHHNHPSSASSSTFTKSLEWSGRKKSQRRHVSGQKSSSSQFAGQSVPTSRMSQKQFNYVESRGGHHDTIDSVDATLHRHHSGRRRLGEISNRITLKEGASLHYNPLHIKRNERTSHNARAKRDYLMDYTKGFRDPFYDYSHDEKLKLDHVLESMLDRDSAVVASRRDVAFAKGCPVSKGIIFSLSKQQTISVVTKLLLEATRSRRSEKHRDESSLPGETLIVVRDKEDVKEWKNRFKETDFSVLVHSDLPSSERKRSATASRCATFNIVISTYEALKAQDTTIQLDDDGHAVTLQNAGSQMNGGWLLKRSSETSLSQRPRNASSQRIAPAVLCQKLSVFHRVHWRRVIFTDELGRKSYTAKPDTARAAAAIAVSGNSRFVFFTSKPSCEKGSQSAFEALHRSDKRAIESVAAVLRIDIKDDVKDDDVTLLDVIIDPTEGLQEEVA